MSRFRRLIGSLAVIVGVTVSASSASAATIGTVTFDGLFTLTIDNFSQFTLPPGDDFSLIEIELTSATADPDVTYGYGLHTSLSAEAFVPLPQNSLDFTFSLLGPAQSLQFLFVDPLTAPPTSLNPFDYSIATVTVRFKGTDLSASVPINDQGATADLVYDVAPVPEPGTWLLVGAGSALLGAARRRRRNDPRA